MKTSEFVHLHVHSHYSLLDAVGETNMIIETARRFGMPAIAVTDHGNMFGAIEFYQNAIKAGVKPIIGFEAYLTEGCRLEKDGTSFRKPLYHLILLAKNINGYKNLIKLSSFGYTEGYYYKPRIDWELLQKHHDGIIALSGCLQGEVPWKLMHGDDDGAKKAVRRYQDVFGRDNFFLEIQNHGLAEQTAVLPKIVSLARSCDAPIVATNDSHYIEADDWEAHDILLCIQTGSTMKDPNRFKFGTHEFYLKSPQLMGELFKDFPEALINTLSVAERCNLQLSLGKSILPHFPVPVGMTSEMHLEQLCREMIPHRYLAGERGAAGKRLDDELGIIRKLGLCDYFLIAWDFVKHAREVGIPVGPGQGAAGSIVNYLLRITDLDPILHMLLFEPFLNQDRISVPDIGIAFSEEGRQKVSEYIFEKYGRDKVSQIITFSRLFSRDAVRMVGSALEIPLPEVERIVKPFPEKRGTHLKSVLNEISEVKEIAESGTEEQKRLLRLATTLEGTACHTGIHPTGIVIAHEPLEEVVPMHMSKSKEFVTQYEKNSLENIGFAKIDIICINILSVIQKAFDFIKASHGIEADQSFHTFTDKATYEILCLGLSEGVFQLEAEGMRSLMKQLEPSIFSDIIALLAMNRPGALDSGMVDELVKCKHGIREMRFLHTDLVRILKTTYGVFLYQEQIMQAAHVMADIPMNSTASWWRNMARMNIGEIEEMKILFSEGAARRGISKQMSQEIFEVMVKDAPHCFSKAHATSYAVLSYQTAWLKAHYPTELLMAMVASEITDPDKIKRYAEECLAFGVEVSMPKSKPTSY